MCQIFINADPALYATCSRSLRLHGVSTSIRLENAFWNVLEEIGQRDEMTVNQLIAKLYNELIETGADATNFTSFLRVCCTRYLALQVARRIPADRSVPIRSLDPAFVLAGEHSALQMRAKTSAHDRRRAAPARP